MKLQTTCIDCGAKKQNVNETMSFQCEPCKDALINRINKNYRNIEKVDEPRIDFLIRMSKELNLNHTKKEVEYKIYQGYEDWQILNTETLKVWTLGSASKALPFHYQIK